MAAGAYTFVNTARTKILDGGCKSGLTYKLALFTTTNAVTTASTLYSGLSNEVTTTNTGYSTGGATVGSISLAGTASVTWSFGSSAQWTAGSANLSAYQGALYETSGSNILVFFFLDSGSAQVTATSGNTLTVTGSPVFTLA